MLLLIPCAACAICNTDVVHGKDEPLHCQSCDQTTHRYCSGVTLTEYKAHGVNDSPYECPHCFKVRQQATVTDLQDCIATLKAEIRELRSTVQELSNKVEASESKEVENESIATWSKVVRRGKRKKKSSQQEQVQVAPTTANAHTTESQARATGLIPKTRRKFITVPGSRRIWGTMKNTTCAAIQNAVRRFTPGIPNQRLSFKRKYKSANDGTVTKWWFVVRGEESLLADLDNQWNTITTQLGWKLQPTYSFDESVPTPQQEAADNLDSTTTGTTPSEDNGIHSTPPVHHLANTDNGSSGSDVYN